MNTDTYKAISNAKRSWSVDDLHFSVKLALTPPFMALVRTLRAACGGPAAVYFDAHGVKVAEQFRLVKREWSEMWAKTKSPRERV